MLRLGVLMLEDIHVSINWNTPPLPLITHTLVSTMGVSAHSLVFPAGLSLSLRHLRLVCEEVPLLTSSSSLSEVTHPSLSDSSPSSSSSSLSENTIFLLSGGVVSAMLSPKRGAVSYNYTGYKYLISWSMQRHAE